MTPCDSLLDFLSRRLGQSRPAGAIDLQQIFREYAIREINLLLWLSLIAVTAFLLRNVFMVFKLWSYGGRIPGPPCPFYGHSALFLGTDSQESLTELLVKSHEKYGSIVKLWMSPTQLLVSVKEPSVIHEMLSNVADKLPLTGRVYQLAFGSSSFFVSSFEKVRRSRDSLAKELNGKMLEKANLMTDRVVDSVMERIRDKMDEGTLDCRLFSQHMAFSFLGATLFGDVFFAWSKANVYEELIIRIAKDVCFWASYSVPPFWKRGYWKYRNLCTKLRSMTQDLVQHRCPNYKLSCQPRSTERSLEWALDMSCSGATPKPVKSTSQEPFGHLKLREEPCGDVMGLMFHGCLTTSAFIGNILARLVMHPEIQEQIYLEIITARRKSDKLNKENISELRLLLATVYESTRLLPAGPLLQRCSLTQDLELKNGLHIPAGTVLVAPIHAVQMDESNWGSDAGEFNPYRFLVRVEKKSELGRSSKTTGAAGVSVDSGEGSYILSDAFKNAAFLPFGSGIRACVGQKFTVLGITSIFASLLERYEIRSVPEASLEPKPLMINCVLQLVPSPKIVFIPRNA